MAKKEKQITILGENVTIRFCMAVEVAYEDITGEPFNVKSLDKQKNIAALCMAAIIVNNPDTKITADTFLRDVSAEEFNIIASAVIETMTDWMQIPSVVPKEDGEQENQQEEEPEKNA